MSICANIFYKYHFGRRVLRGFVSTNRKTTDRIFTEKLEITFFLPFYVGLVFIIYAVLYPNTYFWQGMRKRTKIICHKNLQIKVICDRPWLSEGCKIKIAFRVKHRVMAELFS